MKIHKTFLIIGVFFVGFGVWLGLGNGVPATTGAGGYQLDGYERLLALGPIFVGVLILLGAFERAKDSK